MQKQPILLQKQSRSSSIYKLSASPLAAASSSETEINKLKSDAVAVERAATTEQGVRADVLVAERGHYEKTADAGAAGSGDPAAKEDRSGPELTANNHAVHSQIRALPG